MRSFLYYTESNGYMFPGHVGGGCREQEPVSYGAVGGQRFVWSGR
jgi:hypothetical protein